MAISAITLNRRIEKRSNHTELLGKIQIYLENQKNDRTYILIKNIEMTIENEMLDHSKLEMTFSVLLSDDHTLKKVEEIRKETDMLYNNKAYIGINIKDGKTLFYGVIEKLSFLEKTGRYSLKAVSITKLIDRFPQFVDFKTGYPVKFFLKKMENKIQKYLLNEAENTEEKIDFIC